MRARPVAPLRRAGLALAPTLALSITADYLDNVHGGPGDDTIDGAGGSVLTGGPGDDLIVDSSPEVLLGGPGDDRFVNSIGQISTDGGPGFDHMEFDLDKAGAVPISLTGLIDLTLTDAHLLLSVPGAAPGILPITAVERQYWTLLRGGEQRFDASAFSGSVNLRGLSGKDTLIGAKGSDVLRGGQGPDVIDARDGGFDVVDCGPGVDVAYVDPVDRVVDCETVI